jgi:large subunit ribosomal protein L10
MPTTKKRVKVKELQALLTGSQVLIFTDYRGMTVSEITNLRRQLRDKGVEYHVTKNTLTTLAATRANLDMETLTPLLDGPTAIAFVGEDIPGGTKALSDFVRTSRVMSIRGGMVGRQIITADQVSDLTKILTREQYIAQMLGSMKAPMSNLVGVLSNTIRGVMNVLNAHIEKRKEAGEGQEATDTVEATAEAPTQSAEQAPGEANDTPAEAPAAENTSETPAEAPGEDATPVEAPGEVMDDTSTEAQAGDTAESES